MSDELYREADIYTLQRASRTMPRYWMVIKPAGNFVSRQLLLAIKRRAEVAQPLTG